MLQRRVLRRALGAAVLFLGATAPLCGLGGCTSTAPVATMRDMPSPVDDLGRPIGPMPLAVGDRVGRAVYMNRASLVARGVVREDSVFATGSMPVNPAD